MPTNKSILLIDDEEIIREDFRIIFASTVYHLDVASSCVEGMEKVNLNQYVLVILDIIMPDFNGEQSKRAGLDFLKKLTKLKPNIPIIMLSAINEVKTAVEAIKMGASDYLTKDKFSNDELIAKCDYLIYFGTLETEITKILRTKKEISMYQLYKEFEGTEGLEKSKFKVILDNMERNNKIEIDSQYNIKIRGVIE